MTTFHIGVVTTHGYQICGHCHEYLSADNPGEWDGSRWVCVACLVAALLRIHEAMIRREAMGK